MYQTTLFYDDYDYIEESNEDMEISTVDEDAKVEDEKSISQKNLRDYKAKNMFLKTI